VNILALDLGTKTGWALSRDGAFTAGTWVLGTPKEITEAKKTRLDRRCDPRFLSLLHYLSEAYSSVPHLDWAVFEDVEFTKSRMQAHLWATWRAAVWGFFGLKGISIDCLATGKLKHFATGNGGADKDQMARALTLDPRYRLDKGGVYDTLQKTNLDDNGVDATHLLLWAIKTFK
jgi:Holliday junction resolvasome RuvABC endonuclease subunit